MKHDTVVLEKADKVAIAVAIAAFLVISGFLLKESAANHAHQAQKAEQAVKILRVVGGVAGEKLAGGVLGEGIGALLRALVHPIAHRLILSA